MTAPRAIPEKKVLEGLPVHLQQALLIAACVLRRMSAKRLDTSDNASLIDTAPTGGKGGSTND